MTKSVEFCFDIVSPAAYIAWHVIPKIAAAAGAELIYTPIFLGGVMQATGNRPPGEVAAKKAWMNRDLTRWAGLYGLPFRRNETFPQMTLTVMRGAVAYLDDPRFRAYGDTLYKAMHADNEVIQEPETLVRLLGPLGFEAEEFMARVSDPAVKETLKANTERAVERGMFGAPTFFVGEAMHFGQDRLWMVAEDLGVNIHEAMGDGT